MGLLKTVAVSIAAAVGVGCGGTASSEGKAGVEAEAPAQGGQTPAAPPTDPLLTEARASIQRGAIDPAVEAKIMASADPAHARAQRLLAAMKEPVPEPDEEPPPTDDPALAAPPLSTSDVDPAPTPAASPAPRGEPPTSKTPTKAPVDAPAVASTTVSSLGLKKSGKGATLTIRGSGKLVVGTANQLSSGVVHLVLDRAKVSAKALAARPKLAGVAVTRVRKGEGTVQISLELEPGWTLGSVESFSGGTRVHLQRPS